MDQQAAAQQQLKELMQDVSTISAQMKTDTGVVRLQQNEVEVIRE